MLKLMFTSYFVLITVNRKHFVQAQTSNPPLNAAANVGDKVVINCTTGASMIPRWRYSSGSLSFTSISDVGICNSLFPARFFVESTGPGNCNLIIPSATTAEALVYQCEDGGSFDHLMALTIIESIEVFPNSAAEEPCPGDPLNIICSVNYSAVSTSDLQMFPSIMWTNLSANVNISGTTPSPMPPNVITSYLSIVVIPPTVLPYKCNVYFNAPNVTLQGFANNAPNYYKSTPTAQLQVGCIRPNITETSHNESGICEYKILECHPNAYPPPHDVHWLDVIRNEVVNGTNITAEFGGEYICSVTNVIKTASVAYKLNDDSAFTMDPCKGVSEVRITTSMDIPSKIYKVDVWKKISLQSNVNTYSCGNATITTENVPETLLICTANGLPNPTYVWYDQCQSQISTDQQTIVNISGSYTCVANNSINGRIFIASNKTEISSLDIIPSTGSSSSDGWLLLLLILLLLLFVLPACVFLLYYGCSKSCRENVNDEFPWIEKASPCMNGKGCECSGGMVLFIFCLVIGGIIFVPYVLIASHCCQKNSKKSQRDNYSLQERNGSKSGRHQSVESHQARSNSTGVPNQPPPARPNSTQQVDPSRNPHANSLHSRPPPSSSRATHSPSPVSASAVEYGELMIDAKPGSRKPVELIIQKESAYAELHTS